MANYDIIRPIKHPLKCHLSSVEKEQLEEKLGALADREREILQWLLLANRRVGERTLAELQGITAKKSPEINNLWSRYGFIKKETERLHDQNKGVITATSQNLDSL